MHTFSQDMFNIIKSADKYYINWIHHCIYKHAKEWISMTFSIITKETVVLARQERNSVQVFTYVLGSGYILLSKQPQFSKRVINNPNAILYSTCCAFKFETRSLNKRCFSFLLERFSIDIETWLVCSHSSTRAWVRFNTYVGGGFRSGLCANTQCTISIWTVLCHAGKKNSLPKLSTYI